MTVDTSAIYQNYLPLAVDFIDTWLTDYVAGLWQLMLK